MSFVVRKIKFVSTIPNSHFLDKHYFFFKCDKRNCVLLWQLNYLTLRFLRFYLPNGKVNIMPCYNFETDVINLIKEKHVFIIKLINADHFKKTINKYRGK